MAKTKFRPLHDRVVVKRIDAEEKSKGGIIIPDTAKEKPSQGEVVAVGPGARDEAGNLVKPDVKSGDRVLFGKWSGTEVVLDGEELLIMKESDIMGCSSPSGRIFLRKTGVHFSGKCSKPSPSPFEAWRSQPSASSFPDICDARRFRTGVGPALRVTYLRIKHQRSELKWLPRT